MLQTVTTERTGSEKRCCCAKVSPLFLHTLAVGKWSSKQLILIQIDAWLPNSNDSKRPKNKRDTLRQMEPWSKQISIVSNLRATWLVHIHTHTLQAYPIGQARPKSQTWLDIYSPSFSLPVSVWSVCLCTRRERPAYIVWKRGSQRLQEEKGKRRVEGTKKFEVFVKICPPLPVFK